MLQALVHAGGILADAMLSNQRPSYMRAAIAGKLTGAQLLRRTTVEHPMAHTLLFSSVAALLGSAGQAGYAAANAGLDSLAEHWRESGSPVMSLQWGPWAGAGMAGRHGSTAARAAASGLDMITPAAGLAALEDAASMGADSPATIVAAQFLWRDVHSWGRDRSEAAGAVKPLFAAFAEETPTAELQPGSALQPVYARPGVAITKDGVMQDAEEVVSSVLRGLLGDDIAPDQPLMEAGLDSLGACSLALTRDLSTNTPGSCTASRGCLPLLAQRHIKYISAFTCATSRPVPKRAVHNELICCAERRMFVLSFQLLPATACVPAGAVDLRNALEQALGIRLPATLIFDHPTPAALRRHAADLLQHHDGAPSSVLAPQVMPPPAAAQAAGGGAARRLVGVSAAVHRLPGGRDSDSALQSAAADSATVLPLTRWEVDTVPRSADSMVRWDIVSS